MQPTTEALRHPPKVGLAAELLLATLNTNVHVYQVSPVLTLIEKKVTKDLARLFGYTSEYANQVPWYPYHAALHLLR